MSLNEAEYEALLSAGNVPAVKQTNYYFVASGMPQDVMVRIRHKNGGYMFCYKKLLKSYGGINVCDEREARLDESAAYALLDFGVTPSDLKALVDVDLPYTLKCAGSLDTYRAAFTLDCRAIELDKNEYLGVTDYELECECASDELLNKLKDYLLNNFSIAYKPSPSKSARFFKRLLQTNNERS